MAAEGDGERMLSRWQFGKDEGAVLAGEVLDFAAGCGIAAVAAAMWMIENPGMGVCVPDELPHDYVLGISKPYLGKFISTPSDWTPLQSFTNVFEGYASLDIDPTDLGLFGTQLGRHFQKHYDGYCYLPQYVFCGEFLLAAQLRPGDVGAMSGAMELLQKIVTRIRQTWPDVRITIRGDGHFSDERLMSWCEATPGLEFIVGMPSNARLLKEVQEAQRQMAAEFAATQASKENCVSHQEPPRTFVEIPYRTLDSWSQPRRVVAKVEHLPGPTGNSVSAGAVADAEKSAVQAEHRVAEARSAAASATATADRQRQSAERLAGLAATMSAAATRAPCERAKSLRANAKSTRKQAQRAESLARKNRRAAATAERRVEVLQTQAAEARRAPATAESKRSLTEQPRTFPIALISGNAILSDQAKRLFSPGVPLKRVALSLAMNASFAISSAISPPRRTKWAICVGCDNMSTDLPMRLVDARTGFCKTSAIGRQSISQKLSPSSAASLRRFAVRGRRPAPPGAPSVIDMMTPTRAMPSAMQW